MYRITAKEERKIVDLDIEHEYNLIQIKKCLHPVMVRDLIRKKYFNNLEQAELDAVMAKQMATMNGGEIDSLTDEVIDDAS